MIIAIDGPAGTGKSTISNLIAKSLNLFLVDTGAMYRCVAYKMLKEGILLEDKEKILKILENINIEFKDSNNRQRVYLNGEEVTEPIRSKEVSELVSPVSAIKDVRYKLVEMQRELAKNKNVVMEGRDIGTYVFPNADIKIYLDASAEERVKRRYEENLCKGINVKYEEIMENIVIRDKIDSSKEIGALKIAEDAIVVDTTGKTLEQVQKEIEGIIKQKM